MPTRTARSELSTIATRIRSAADQLSDIASPRHDAERLVAHVLGVTWSDLWSRADQELSKRLIDFASGLTYALNGGMQRVADKVFLLTPRNVEVSAEERARMLERGGFFNQA